jgi:hypothetical protein
MAGVMDMAQKDSVYGMVSSSFPLYESGLDQSGMIYVCEGGLVIKNEGKMIRAPFDYVRKLEKVDALPLGKVSFIIKVFDQMGVEHDMASGMNDMHYDALVKLCPKSQPKKKNTDDI